MIFGCRWDLGQKVEGEATGGKAPVKDTVRQLVELISGDRGLIGMATLFGVRGVQALGCGARVSIVYLYF